MQQHRKDAVAQAGRQLLRGADDLHPAAGLGLSAKEAGHLLERAVEGVAVLRGRRHGRLVAMSGERPLDHLRQIAAEVLPVGAGDRDGAEPAPQAAFLGPGQVDVPVRVAVEERLTLGQQAKDHVIVAVEDRKPCNHDAQA